jgi:Tol biopolymer transport system component
LADDRRAITDLADAVLDGSTVDWDVAATTSPAADRDLIPHLRLVARIAEAHRAERGEGPASWAHLELRGRIGQGAFGEVHRAWDPRLEREVALKLLGADERPEGGSASIAEAALLARVRHPNVVTVYGAQRVEGRVGLWMELIEGRSMDRVLREQGPFGAHEAGLVALSVCRALSAVHRAGLVHRDVKAQNVMREDGGRILLMDFGTGSLLGDHAGALAGTPLYVAPELFAGGPPTVASDIYAVGVLMFHLATGSFPVSSLDLEGLRRAHTAGPKRYLRDERPDLPDDFVTVVEKAMAAEPSGRFPSAGALEAALGAIVGARTPGRRGWVVAASLIAVGVAAAALAAMPRGWSGGLVTMAGGPTPPDDGAIPPALSPVVVRQVTLPPAMLVGRPSPDGRLFSFSDEAGDLALYEPARQAIVRLTSHEAETEQHALYPAISSDSRFVAYAWMALDGRYEMRVVGADGKRPRVVLRSEAVDEPQPVEWYRDGASILSILTTPDGANRLALVAADGSGTKVLRDLGSDVPLYASRSPDGEHVVYDAPATPSDEAREIYIVDAEGGEPRTLAAHPANDVAPVWTPDGQHILFASDRSGSMDLWRVKVAAGVMQGEPEVVHRNVGRMRFLGLTDGGAYYYQAVVGAVDVYSAEIAADGTVSPPKPLGTSNAGANISSAWSRDGRFVASASRRGLVGPDRRSTTLAIVDLEANERRDLAPTLKSFLVRSWSPDGRTVLVQGSDLRSRSGLFSVDVYSGAVTEIAVADRPSDDLTIGTGEWIDAGRVLYHRRRALCIRDVATGADEKALDFDAEGIDAIDGVPAGRGFAIAGDGRTLAFSALVSEGAERATSLRVKVLGQPSREILRVPAPGRLVLQDLSRDGRTVLFTRRDQRGGGSRAALWRLSVDGGTPEQLAVDLKAVREVSLQPGGRRISFTAGVPLHEVWVIEDVLSAVSTGGSPR